MVIHKVLVVGATGSLGGKVVKELLMRGKHVRALVREQSDASSLQAQGVEIVRGDLTVKETLISALSGIDALITTAIGYTNRRKGDSLAAVDDKGNRNLVEAAAETKLGLFVFTSILAADQAEDVPHFYQKKRIEDYLKAKGVPFVSLRPGGFVDTLLTPHAVMKGSIRTMIDPNAKASTILSDDVARFLVMALDEADAKGKIVDLGTSCPVSIGEIAAELSRQLGREIRASAPPPWIGKFVFAVIGFFNPFVKGLLPSVKFVESGKYVADIAEQERLFGRVPTLEESLQRWIANQGLLLNRR
ncbi:SDR family oxidoreductase [Paenibacillus roseipurpureus]|uniref:SDR family oxidoreductase n=1 Tax=Paenibacillus roseopurpureus TaxID=2918901 RepID=A0AA96LVG6_9BACL|nr:SDR family oxidoreductase [Paenibacillus sp. MBLB1832]WNR45400.1 SDR family oxidoreductase [Paenibacillus sp. MBLB1832]